MNPAPKQPDQSTYSGRFAARLKSLREASKLTVEQLAVASGNKARTIYSWESGDREPPFDALPSLANALGLKTVRAMMPEK